MLSLAKLRRLYPLLLLGVLLLTGCSGAQPDAASTQAAQTPRPDSEAAPLAGAAAGTAMPSAPADSMAASPSGAAPAGAETGAASAAPPAASGAGTGTAPSSAAAVTEGTPVTAGSAPAATAPAPGQAGASASQPSAQPAAGANPPAAAKPSAAAPDSSVTRATPRAAAVPHASAPAAASHLPAATAATVNTVTLSITGDEEHGVILAAAAYDIGKNETALELLKRITRKHKIQMEYQGSKAFAYVEGIDNLYESDHGPESGWMYKVNGEFPSKAAGSWIMSPGDTIEWLYTLDLGKDLGAKAP